MNLLPKSRENFSQKEYWESFFKKRGTKAFEWYGEYLELCSYIHSKIQKSEAILMIGCGNSSLSMDMYDSGYKNITNIDISNTVIKQQTKLNSRKRPDMKYLVMDALNTSFDSSTFSTTIDKGTLDALMSDESNESAQRANKLFNEISRITTDNGRYICVSLLQEHILRRLLEYFMENEWMIRIERCMEAEEKTRENGEVAMPVFVITCVKNTTKSMVEVCILNETKTYKTIDDVVSFISTMQESSQIINSLNRTNISEKDEVYFDLFQPGDEKNPRYTIYVLDKPYKSKFQKDYSAFIVPQGRETEWLFATKEGRQKFLDLLEYRRLAIVVLNRGQKFESLEHVKTELNDHVKRFAPPGLMSKINFLSFGNEIGVREIKYEGESDISGPFIVEDSTNENEQTTRRLIFLNSQHIVQSEAKLKSVKGRRGKKKLIVDSTYISCAHHIYMSVGAHTVCPSLEGDIAVIGLGGGALCTFLRTFLPKSNITAIDIDPAMLTTATDWFGLETNQQMKVIIKDGLDFLEDETKNHSKYKAILFDIDSKDPTVGMSCPPKSFLQPIVMDNVVKLIGEDGIFVLNLVMRNQSLYNDIVDGLKGKFESVVSYKLEDDLNEIFYCGQNRIEQRQFQAKLIPAFLRITQLEKDNKIQKLEIELKDVFQRIKLHK